MLPNNKKNLNSIKGFTLIELLVVIAIIAVLAIIGFAVFNGLTTRGNDSRRQTDIKAIADAIEVERGTATSYGGVTVTGSDFATGNLPADPTSGRQYCIKTGTTVVSNATLSGTDGINVSGVCQGTWANFTGAAIAANQTFFKVCVLLADNSTIRCAGSKQ